MRKTSNQQTVPVKMIIEPF